MHQSLQLHEIYNKQEFIPLLVVKEDKFQRLEEGDSRILDGYHFITVYPHAVDSTPLGEKGIVYEGWYYLCIKWNNYKSRFRE
jgi:hypothetical protein